MQHRTFDMLTEPLNPGERNTAIATVRWLNARNFQVAPAPAIVDRFDVAPPALDADGLLTIALVCKGDKIARFAAVVTCDTDEADPEVPRDFAASWPDLLDA